MQVAALLVGQLTATQVLAPFIHKSCNDSQSRMCSQWADKSDTLWVGNREKLGHSFLNALGCANWVRDHDKHAQQHQDFQERLTMIKETNGTKVVQ